MIKPPIRVNAAHPSTVLPVQARIDYRRLCEVEHAVRVQDVGLVNVDSMSDLLAALEPVRAKSRDDGDFGEEKTGKQGEEDGDLDVGIE